MNRPNTRVRLPELLYIIGCEGKNQEKLYFERIKKIINNIESRKKNINFIYAEPYGGDPLCVVKRTIEKSIGKINKLSVFDYDGKQNKYEEAIDLACENKILLGYNNYCFDLWLILHKEEYTNVVEHQDDYISKVREVFNLPNNANIKTVKRVTQINEQINLSEVNSAIIRAKRIEDAKSNEEPLKTPSENKYYINPDTKMHNVLLRIFKEVGLGKLLV